MTRKSLSLERLVRTHITRVVPRREARRDGIDGQDLDEFGRRHVGQLQEPGVRGPEVDLLAVYVERVDRESGAAGGVSRVVFREPRLAERRGRRARRDARGPPRSRGPLGADDLEAPRRGGGRPGGLEDGGPGGSGGGGSRLAGEEMRVVRGGPGWDPGGFNVTSPRVRSYQ